jgi:AraC family transcriptional regulator
MKLAQGQYYGNINKSCNAGGLILSKSDYTGKNSLPSHHHENPYFCYVIKGGYREQSRSIDEYCSKGDIIFHPPETSHSDTFTDNFSVCFNIELSGKWRTLLEKRVQTGKITKTNYFKLQQIALKIYAEMNTPDELSQLVSEGLMIDMLDSFSKTEVVYDLNPAYLKTVYEYVTDSHPVNPALNELSAIAGVSPEHLAREFKNKFNTTIGEYARGLKISRAIDLLCKTDRSLAQIAYEAGFADQSHFTRTFRKVLGITPKAYRSIS